jgi:hypothetical protein
MWSRSRFTHLGTVTFEIAAQPSDEGGSGRIGVGVKILQTVGHHQHEKRPVLLFDSIAALPPGRPFESPGR